MDRDLTLTVIKLYVDRTSSFPASEIISFIHFGESTELTL